MSEVLAKISRAVTEGDLDSIGSLTEAALSEGLSAKEILDGGLLHGMNYVGVQFKKGEMFIPEVLRSAQVMLISEDILKPLLVAGGAKMMGVVVIGTVKGDVHTIGKNLVAMMIQGAGFEVHDLGADVSPQHFVEAVKKYKPDIVAMSALLTTTMGMLQNTIIALAEGGVRDSTKIMVGGAPVTADFAEEIGADGYGADAIAAAELAKQFVAAN